jgi:uncharacterized protein
MRRSDRELTQKPDLLAILEQADVCRLAFNTGSAPYIVPLNFGFSWDSGLLLYFHCAASGRKLDLMQQNNRVGFEIDTDHHLKPGSAPCGWGMSYASLIGSGLLTEVLDEGEKFAALDRIMFHYGYVGTPSYDSETLKKIKVLKLEVLEMTGKRNS